MDIPQDKTSKWLVGSKHKRPAEEIANVKQLVELVVSIGREYQSPQTGFVHLFYQKLAEPSNDTIPIYENFLFALALIRLPFVKNVQEGKSLIEKLLHFQSEEGNFPLYLHEYPKCVDSYQGARLLLPIYWLLKEYSKELGSELEGALKKSALSLLEFVRGLDREKMPFRFSIKVAASLVAFGKLFKNSEREFEGETWLEQLNWESKEEAFGSWCSPEGIGNTIAALSILYPKLSKSPWNHFWEHLTETWSSEFCSYVGPAVQLYQLREEPEVGLYDFYLGEISKQFSYRLYQSSPSQFEAVLVHHFDESLKDISLPHQLEGRVGGMDYLMQRNESYAYSAMRIPFVVPGEIKKGLHSFRMTFGDLMNTHTLSCQGGRISATDFKVVEGGIDLFYWTEEEVFPEDREKSYEVNLFLNRDEAIDLQVNGRKATTFRLGDEISVNSANCKFTIRYEMASGEGYYMGHLMPSNRLSQKGTVGENQFETYDTRIGLRVVRRKGPCCLVAQIRFS